MVSPLSFNTSALMPRGLNTATPQGLTGGLTGGLNASGFSSIGGGAPGLDAASLHNMGVSNSSLMLMAQINMMMASVLSGIGMLMQQIMASVQQRQQTGVTGAAPGGSSAVANTSGGNNPGGTAAVSSSGAPGGVTGAVPSGSNSAMDRVAAAGRQSAARRGTTGMCLAGVNDALEAAGLGVARKPSAYMAADVLAGDSRFKEVKVGQGQLASLPPGCIIVWDRGAGHEHGHIAITQPGGKETSDHEQNLITNYGTGFRVFVPQG